MRRRIEAELIRLDAWARREHQSHTETVRPDWCPLCHRPRYRLTPQGLVDITPNPEGGDPCVRA